ncbi:MAG: hypothetical protein RXR82_04545 [Nitrososphaeria archaeon]
MAGEPRYLVEVIEAEKPPRIPPEYTEGLKGVLSAKRISALKKEVVNCPVIGSQVPFLVCFQCQSFLRRVKGTVQCAGKDPPRWPPSRSGDSSKRRDPPGRQQLRRPVHQPAKCPERCEKEALPGRASPLGGARRSDARLRPCLEDPLREGMARRLPSLEISAPTHLHASPNTPRHKLTSPLPVAGFPPN